MRATAFKTVIAAAASLLALTGGAWAKESPAMFMKAVDTNADRTISMKEVDAYAMKRFDELNRNPNKDDTLSMAEIGDRMTPAEFKAANTVHRSTSPSLSKAEFKSYVDKLFVEANTSVKAGGSAASGTLSEKELGTPAGESLIRLLE